MKIFIVLVLPLILFAQDNYSFGPNVKVNDDLPGSSYHGIRSSGQHGIACRGDTVYAVFSDERGGPRATYFARSTDAGQTWNPNIRVAGGLSGFATGGASITLDAQGWIYVACMSWEPGPESNVYFTMSTDGGASFSDSVLVNDTINAQMPSIAVDSSGQNVFIAWEDTRNPNPPTPNYDIYFARSTDGGATFLPNIRIDDTGTDSSWQRHNSIDCTWTGDTIYIAWDDERNSTEDIYFSRSIDGGQSFEPNILVNDTAATTPSTQWQPSLCVSKTGIIYTIWQDYRSGDHYHLYCDKSTDGGVSFNQDVEVSDTSTSCSYPSVAVDDSDYVYVAWRDVRTFSTTGHDIYFSFSADSGSTFSPDVRVNDLGGFVGAWDWNANVTANNQGKVFVAWDTDRNDPFGNLDIYSATGDYVGIQEYCGPKPAIILQCCPNPFTQMTNVICGIAHGATSIEEYTLSVNIYDASGRMVKSFTLSPLHSALSITWCGDDDFGQEVPVGIYFVELVSNNEKYVKKIVKIE